MMQIFRKHVIYQVHILYFETYICIDAPLPKAGIARYPLTHMKQNEGRAAADDIGYMESGIMALSMVSSV
jgi:hypothetical protein